MSCTCPKLMLVEWTEFQNDQPYFVRGYRHESACAERPNGWTFDGRGSFDACYEATASGSTEARLRRATLHALFIDEPWGALFREVLHAMHWLPTWIRESVKQDPLRAFEPVQIIARRKEVRVIDLLAECLLVSRLRERLAKYDAVILGEESLRDPEVDLSKVGSPVILVDAVDGTKQLERDVDGHWCSAAVIFHPPTREILGSFVALPDGWIFFCVGSHAAKCRLRGSELEIAELAGPSSVTAVEKCAVAFYGQKKDYLRVNAALVERLEPFLIWPGGGNPAIVRLVDGRSVDAVYEMRGQWPHDVIPALVIARARGATLVTPDGEPLDLYRPLCQPGNPRSRLRYIAASTPALAAGIAHEVVASSSARASLTAELVCLPAAS